MFAMHPTAYSPTVPIIIHVGMHSNMYHPDYPNEKLSQMTPLGSRFVLGLPVIGIHFKLWGIQSVDPNNLRRLMQAKEIIGIFPGGYEEATLTTPAQMRMYIKSRKGFIKYALKYGYTIRPVLILNEHQNLCTFDGLKGLRLFLNKFKIPATVFWSRYGLYYPPFKHYYTIVGRGMKGRAYGEGEEPSQQEIDEMHARYIEAFVQLYEKHKDKNNSVPIRIY